MKLLKVVILMTITFFVTSLYSQSETFSTGSFIINMGSPLQTIENGLKPYGMVYELLKTYKVPVKWVIGYDKNKDAKDFTYLSVDYRGGTFIIPKEFISQEVMESIRYWKEKGVMGVFTTSELTVMVSETLTSVPRWTLNPGNMAIAQKYFINAGIPSTAYDIKSASKLNSCSDIFVIAHAEPNWEQVGKLYDWNRKLKGAIWVGCHAASELENLVNPMDSNQKLNFLTTNGLMDHDSHTDGNPAFNYLYNGLSFNGDPISARADDPVFQMIGQEDAAHLNGSEQIYIPESGSAWRNSTHIGCYDSSLMNAGDNSTNGPAAITLYGRGFGLDNAGLVMYQSGHNLDGNSPANVSAMRQFFNFSLVAMKDKVPVISSSITPPAIESGYNYLVSVSAVSPVNNTLHYHWTSTCSGEFGDENSAVTTFSPIGVDSNAHYTITCVVTDDCSHYTFISNNVVGTVALPVTLISFTAKYEFKDVQLSWSSAEESNLDRYEIYRSFDGQDFNLIDSIKSVKNSLELQNYIYTDKNIVDLNYAVCYYKLKMIDEDEGYKWSNIARVKFEENNKDDFNLSIFPVPAIDDLNINFNGDNESEYTITVLDANGKQVLVINNTGINSEVSLMLNIKDLENGIYMICVTTPEGRTVSGKFVKQRL